ncbi:hypothetical protein DERF_007328 [Dermatophagoides farinae]|uniref:GATA zinc finger domain-containing protein 14-like n=1 Tax=Dermatophagoides farinae TaxID=6954 RepID=A0A922HXP4_DERFA|nr:LIM domain-containing protein A-like [Dermatophagoides farinae]KAH7646201.1 hypothetical protein HUG17_1739 [Dermatophagoides farinae]KAH9516594.1 hypothetical protein DERF_007328 [Dermatophagoides farinae]
MNFKKNKDVKRASYYVWFLGAKESKGLRGDEYVQPVLNYLIDNECDLEPSKVTLQISSKGLKIIQILTIPRKSGKLNPDQQLQLFVATTGNSDPLSSSSSSSVMKSEQVKHHIPHDSISWVYQEDDVICAILLLYNPITRCPVHIHAYRCDSIQTANNLHQQLQTLIDRPENQKKFREIEMRLAAKGLLIPPPSQSCGPLPLAPLPLPPSSNCHHPSSLFDDCSDPRGSMPYDHHHHHDPLLKRSYQSNSPSASKTLNSDGRSTHTDGSDEINSEESNSSDLGYAINRSSSNRNNSEYRSDSKSFSHHQLFNRSSSSKNKSAKCSSKIIQDDGEQSNLFDSLAAELRAKLGNPKMGPLLLPPRDYESRNSENNLKSMDKKRNQHDKHSAHHLTRSESSGKSNSSGLGSDEALCNDQQTARPRSYYFDSCSPANEPRLSNHHQSSYLEHRYNRETSADDLVSRHSDSSSSSDDDDVDVGGGDVNHHERLNSNHGSMVDCLEVDVEDFEEDVIFSTTIPSIHKESRSRSKSTFDLIKQRPMMPTSQQQHQKLSSPTSCNDNDFDVIRTRQRLPNQHVQQQFYREKHLFHPSSSPLTRTKEHNNNNGEQTAATNLHHFGRGRDDHHHHHHYQQQQQQQQHATSDKLNPDFLPTSYNHHNSSSSSSNRKKYYSNPNLEPISSSTTAIQQQQKRPTITKEVNNKIMRQQIINEVDKSLTNTTTTSGLISSSSSVIGRREQRFINPHHQHHRNEENNHSRLAITNKSTKQPAQKFYFADAEFSSNFRDIQHENNHCASSSSYQRGRSMGRLDQLLAVNSNENDHHHHQHSDNYGPMSLNFQSYDNHRATIIADMNDRSISPYYVLQHQQAPLLSSSSSTPPLPPLLSSSKNLKKDLISKRFETPSSGKDDNKRNINRTSQQQQQQFKDHQRRMMFDQPFSRYSYIDMHDDRIEHERFAALMMANRNKR